MKVHETLLVLLLLAVLPAEAAYAKDSANHTTLHLEMYGVGGEAQETIVTFEDGKTPVLVTRSRSDEGRAFLLRIIRRNSRTNNAKQKAGHEISPQLTKYAPSADISPNQELALIDYKEGGYRGYDLVDVIRLPRDRIAELKIDGRICDSLWAPDSKTLYIVEAESRLKLTPKALLFALLSHPTWIDTYYLRIVSFEPLSQSRIQIPGEFENSSASIWRE